MAISPGRYAGSVYQICKLHELLEQGTISRAMANVWHRTVLKQASFQGKPSMLSESLSAHAMEIIVECIITAFIISMPAFL